MTDKTYTIKQSDFDLAFEETMMHFKRIGTDKKTLDNILPKVLGVFEAAVQDKYPTEHIIEKIISNPVIN